MSNKLGANLLAGWNEIEESTGDFPQIEAGAYIVKIDEVENFDDKEYLKIYFDINQGPMKGEFERQHKLFGPDWPYDATQYSSYKEKALPFFKRFITAVERSNSGYSFVKTQGDFEQLKNKLVVAVFGPTEVPVPDAANGNKPRVMIKFREWRSIEALNENKIITPTNVLKLKSNYDLEKYNDALAELQQQAPAEVQAAYETSKGLVDEEDLPF